MKIQKITSKPISNINIFNVFEMTETKQILELNILLTFRLTPGQLRLKNPELNENLKSIIRLKNEGQLLWKILDRF